MVIAFIVVWFLPHVELRSGSSYESRGKQDAADQHAANEDAAGPDRANPDASGQDAPGLSEAGTSTIAAADDALPSLSR